jgi:hypothetical protein
MSVYGGPNFDRTGLVVCLDTSNPRSYTANASVWYDIAGGKSNGATNGGVYDAANMGSFVLDTGNKDFSMANTKVLADTFSTNSFTIIATVKSTDVVYPRSRFPLYVNQNPTSNIQKGWSVGHTATTTRIEVRMCDGANLVNGFINHNVDEATIYHRAFVVDRTNGISTKYYANGDYKGEVAAANITGSIYTSGGLLLGNVWGWRFIGNVYNFYIYNTALNQEQIRENFNAIRSRFNI